MTATKSVYTSTGFTISGFINYVKNPFYKRPDTTNVKDSITYLIKSYACWFVINIVVGVFLFVTDSLIVKYLGMQSVRTQIHTTMHNAKTNFVQQPLLYFAFIAPLFEEIIFRLTLDLESCSLALAISILFFRISGHSLTHPNFYDYNYLAYTIMSIAIFAILILILPKRILNIIKFNHFRWWFYFLALAFGLGHLSNISNFSYKFLLIYIPFAFPQLIMSFFLADIRMRKGFVWGWFFHALINSFAYLML